jgi:hypothetical protein
MNLNRKIVTGICGAAAVFMVGGCGYLGGSSGQSSSGQGQSGQSADDTITMSDAAFLDTAQAEADQAGDSAAPEENAAPGDRRHKLRHPLRARRFFRGVHGEATVRTKEGFKRVAWQRGQVTAASGGNLTVRSADGATWQWVGGQNTKIRKKGEKSSLSQLAANDRVFVIGTVDGSTRTIRAAVVPKRVPRNAPAPSPTAS